MDKAISKVLTDFENSVESCGYTEESFKKEMQKLKENLKDARVLQLSFNNADGKMFTAHSAVGTFQIFEDFSDNNTWRAQHDVCNGKSCAGIVLLKDAMEKCQEWFLESVCDV